MFRKLSLFHRIYLHGILLVLVLAVAVMITVHTSGETPKWQEAFDRAVTVLARQIAASPGELESTIEFFQHVSDANIAVYSEAGKLLARAGYRTLPPLAPDRVNAVMGAEIHTRERIGLFAVPIHMKNNPAYMLIDMHPRGGVEWRFALTLGVALLVIGLMAVPLARSIARPIRQLTETATRLKEGDLSARAAVHPSGEVGVLANTLNEMAASLEQLIAREKELLANVSHELRTPLARIRVALELIEDGDGTEPERLAHLQGIADDIRELEQLVDDVLFSTRLDLASSAPDGTLPLKREPTDIVALMTRAVEQFEKQTGHRPSIESPGESLIIAVDPALVRRLLHNLFSNSLRYADRALDIELTLDETPREVIIEVRDSGIGVPDEALPRLFEPFYRTDKSREKAAGGIGLGLTLCKRIAEAHGGAIEARNRKEKGLAVRVALPKE